MDSLKIVIPGRVKGKGRPRFAMIGGHARAYTPADTRNHEAMIRQIAFEAMRGRKLFEGPVEVVIKVFQIPPPSWSKKKRAAAIFLTGKPDCDNIAKSVDALNSLVWRDDSQISDLHVIRRFTREGPERCEITVTALGAEVDFLARAAAE